MKITTEKFRKIASNLLGLLDREEINSIEDLEKKIGRKYDISSGEYIELFMRPSNSETFAHIISYIWEGSGIPIEARINTKLGYLQMIIKLQENIQNYAPFTEDPYGNIVQNRKI